MGSNNNDKNNSSVAGTPTDKTPSNKNPNSNESNNPTNEKEDNNNNEEEEEEKENEGENEEDDNDQDDDDNENEDNEFSKRVKLNSHTKEELKALLDEFSPDQHRRFEIFRRTALPKNTVKRVSPTLAFVVAGYSKVFIGEITELALDIQKEWNDEGPLTPEHIREAYRKYEANSKTKVNHLHKKRLF